MEIWLVVEPTHLKKYSSNWKSSPNRGENKKYLSCHHLEIPFTWNPAFLGWETVGFSGSCSTGQEFTWKQRPDPTGQLQGARCSCCSPRKLRLWNDLSRNQKLWISLKSSFCFTVSSPRCFWNPVNYRKVSIKPLLRKSQPGSLPPVFYMNIYHLESRWPQFPLVLVYHGPLQIATELGNG